jgi:hypothetical protein
MKGKKRGRPVSAARLPLKNQLFFASAFLSLLVAVLQPPLPLQEFLPLQPLSPAPQPPVPLQAFLPLQSCLPLSAADFSAVPANAFEASEPA